MTLSQTAFTAPHWAATETGNRILQQGGTAIEAMVAAAATIATVYPHMNSIGGDGFWIISEPGKTPVAIDACGTAAANATIKHYKDKGFDQIPDRGADATVTMAGTVKGWQTALSISQQWQASIPLIELFADAIQFNRTGFQSTDTLHEASQKTFADLKLIPTFADQYLPSGQVITPNTTITNTALANTFEQLGRVGLEDFYQGEIAQSLAKELQQAGSVINFADFQHYQAKLVTPLTTKISKGQLFNLPAPTQGIASLIILALYDRLYQPGLTELEQIHLLVECTKQAFMARDQLVTDPVRVTDAYHALLNDAQLTRMAEAIDFKTALPWPRPSAEGDTIWMGACDSEGRMVSFIQSIYWELGSGLVLPETGILWNNRGVSFSLDPGHHNSLQPGMRPFHTLNPAYAELHDGRRMVYGTMGGEGQPQTQAAIFNRAIYGNMDLAQAIAESRWLLGRTWGQSSSDLKLEAPLAQRLWDELSAMGHELQEVPEQTEAMGHAGAIVLKTDHSCEAATDPRSDGRAKVMPASKQ